MTTRLPDAASLETVLRKLAPATADADLTGALARTFPGFAFTVAAIDDPYWRDERTVLGPDAARLGEHRAWLKAELAADDGDMPMPASSSRARFCWEHCTAIARTDIYLDKFF